jgi:probable rRNA maturation factor
MPAAPRFSLSVSAAVGQAYVPFLRRHLRGAHKLLRPPLDELSVAIVGDRRMAELHERFMNVAGPTDVLTFPLDLDPRGRPVSGEVVVCLPEARRRAKEYKVPVERELLLYALHGLLHLCGYDDRTGDDFRAMHRAEDEILTRLGVGPVFAPAAGSAPKRAASRATGARKPVRRGRRRQAASGGGAH